MGFVDWLKRTIHRSRTQGKTGLKLSYWELSAFIGGKIHERLRTYHQLLPNKRKLVAGKHQAVIRQETVGEYDSVQVFRNEKPILVDFCNRVTGEDIVWDIGGNIGMYTQFVAQSCDEVHVFEPLPANVAAIRENILLNSLSNVTVHQVALTDSEGEREFYPDPRGVAGGGRGSLLANWKAETGSITVRCTAGDSVISLGNAPTPSVVKIDVEGAELAVIEGMEEALARESCRLVYCEPHGISDNKVEQKLRSLGFEIDVREHETTAGVIRASK